MPRMSEAEKQKSHRRILDAAARSLRSQGVEATSVADVMQAAGMTHGGFYRHFTSKQDLVAAAIDHAAETVLAPVEGASAEQGTDPLGAYVLNYLSHEHRRNRQDGCPLAAVAGEVLRDDGLARDATKRAARRTARLLSSAPDRPGASADVDDLGLATLSVLVGSIVLARLFEDDRESDRLLQLGRSTVQLLQEHFDKAPRQQP